MRGRSPARFSGIDFPVVRGHPDVLASLTRPFAGFGIDAKTDARVVAREYLLKDSPDGDRILGGEGLTG
jgi:hypothetical protein